MNGDSSNSIMENGDQAETTPVEAELKHCLAATSPTAETNGVHNGDGMQNGSTTAQPNGTIPSSSSSSSQCGADIAQAMAQQRASLSSRQAPDFDYLTQLMKDKRQLAAFPNVFTHVERLLDEEICRVRVSLFQCEFQKEPLQLPEPVGEVITRQEKVFVPVKTHPEYNFVGRILGPRGLTAKQLEAETGCKIMVRGKGSMRDKKKEDANRGRPNWEHLNEELHVLIQCEDSPNRIDVKMARAIDEVQKLLVPSPEGEDELKKKQLMELAIINGTYRNGQSSQQQQQQSLMGGLQSAAAVAAAQQQMNLAAIAAAAAANGPQKPSASLFLHDPRAALLSAQSPLAAVQALSTATPSSTTPSAAVVCGALGSRRGVQQPSVGLANGTPLGHPLVQPSISATCLGSKGPAQQQQQQQQAAIAAATQQQQQQSAAAALVLAQQQAQHAQQLAALQQLAATSQYGPTAATPASVLDYQQLLLSSMQAQQQMDPNGQAALAAQTVAAYQQQQQLSAMFQQAAGDYASAINPALVGLDYLAGQSLVAHSAQHHQQQQRRFLGQHRDHPYHHASASTTSQK